MSNSVLSSPGATITRNSLPRTIQFRQQCTTCLSGLTEWRSNHQYFTSLVGSLMLLELAIGLITFCLLLFGCNSYYDPWLETNRAGFAGGKAETFLLLICFHGLLMTSTVVLFTFFSQKYVQHLESANLLCSLNFTQFLCYIISSLCCFIEVCSRNDGTIHYERNFGTKIAASIFAMINSMVYLFTTIYTFRFSSVSTTPSTTSENEQ